ncbi:metalloprotease [Corynebacterium phocae]|uniref:Metalloprotease n=1 Tax=Corynebacterium phocae TaxID=161895 RepID=A0A1L7D2Z0_9CORY|nr:neutral zinc metallopeptidase [Corynebacterium phocae]APT92437.1 metalloprotease [Corynebacterium phocae]KAA8725038.1 metalloprotease [Corynebacterium phocae]
MTFRSDADLSGKRASSGRGGGRGKTLAAGGGLGTLVMVGLFLLMGGNPGDLGQILGQQPGQTQVEPARDPAAGRSSGGTGEGEDAFAHCQTPEDGNKYDDCRVMYAAISVDRMWAELLPQQAGIDYVEPGRVIFDGAVQTGCGTASASTGPFYCPVDQSAYFDTSFFDQLRRFGADNAPLAQMYIVAHEFGHHVQNLEGTLGLSNYNDPGADSNAVKIELQADCYAEIWAHYADKGDNAMLQTITNEQAQDAIDAARAVGDDNIQQRSGGQVRPDTWTHGSSQQRAEAFLTGYGHGTMSTCDFLERGVYNN